VRNIKTALIIEDNEDNLVLISRLLNKSMYRVIFAVTGHDGIKTAAAEGPDFIILDIQLPDMDGTDVFHSLRQNNATSSIPVIAMTSFAMAGDRERLLAAGFNGYIEKPIDPALVVKQIEDIVNG